VTPGLTRDCVSVDTDRMLDRAWPKPEAGRYAQQRYHAGLKRWRSRVVRPLRWAFLLVGGLLFVAELVWHTSLVDWCLGLAMGVLIGLWVAVSDSPPAHIENWLRGAEGERKTERALSRLARSGWSFAHDIQTHNGNRDHVACGPGGVFLLETKRPGGEVTVEGELVRVQRLDDPELSYDMSRLGSRLRREAMTLSAELQVDTGRRTWVQSVVVVWAPFPQRVVESNRIVYVHGDELAGWLASRPHTLTADRCEEIRAVISQVPSDHDGR
jgi:hypothetical protein